MSISLNKQLIAANFNKAARSYDAAAQLQKKVGINLIDYLQNVYPDKRYNRLLDVGCGTGFLTQLLKDSFSNNFIGLDIAFSMLLQAQMKDELALASFVCADAEQLPLQNNTVDLVFSSLAVQWCSVAHVLSEVQRILNPGGIFCFATLGPSTLNELKTAWQAIDHYVHINRFVDQSEVKNLILKNNLKTMCFTEENIQINYKSVLDLLHELKALGVRNINHGRPAHLMGKNTIKQLEQAYQSYCDSVDTIPATFQVYYIIVKKISKED